MAFRSEAEIWAEERRRVSRGQSPALRIIADALAALSALALVVLIILIGALRHG